MSQRVTSKGFVKQKRKKYKHNWNYCLQVAVQVRLSRRGGKNIYTTGGTTTVKKKEKNRSQLATVLHRHTCMQFDQRFNQQKMNF